MSYHDYSDEEEFGIRIHQTRKSPSPAYPEYRPRPAGQPVYYSHGNSYLVPSGGHRRSSSNHSSHSIRHEAPPPPPVQPLVINNRIYNNEFEDDVLIDERDTRRYLVPHQSVSRSRSHSRPTSFSAHDWELEKTRRELEHYKLKEEQHKQKLENEREMERHKKEMELKKWQEEKKKKEQEAREEAARKEAIEKFKAEEIKRLDKEKKEKEEREKEYKHRMEDDLRKSGLDEQQIAVIMKKEGAKKQALEPARPTYTRMSRRHLSIETLNVHRIEYELDVVRTLDTKHLQAKRTNRKQDPDYILIKRWVPEYEQDFLWKHTREIRDSRHHHHHPQTVVYAIEAKKKKHEEPELEWVRKKEKRRPSPSPLLTFLAGGKGR